MAAVEATNGRKCKVLAGDYGRELIHWHCELHLR